MAQEYVEIIRELLSDPDAITIRYHKIESFHKLLVDELPYGAIDPLALVQGQVEFDGPAADPRNPRRPLQWYFGGIPWEVCKAMRLQYTYEKTIPGLDYPAPVNGSVLLGYVSNPIDSTYYRDAYTAQQTIQGIPATVADLMDIFRIDFSRYPSRTTPDAIYVPTNMFDEFVLENFPWQTPITIDTLRLQAELLADQNSGNAPPPTPLARMLDRGPEPPVVPPGARPNQLPGARIEYDGPARNYYSHDAFPYTTGTLFNEQSGLYDKLLWWYFGGRAFRITKAMHIRYDDSPLPPFRKRQEPPAALYETGPEPGAPSHRGSLLIGYQGPGGYP
jgi:hypothetical protein